MTYQPQLSESEWALVLDLLERERRELHPEIRRSTMSVDTHEGLQKRLQLVNDLLQRMRNCPRMM